MRNLLKKLPSITGPARSYFNYFFGEKEISFLIKYLKKYKKNFIFVDVGANYGIYTFIFGLKSEFTYVVEPIIECINYIEKGYLSRNIVLINKVASNDEGDKDLFIPFENNKLLFGRSSINNNFEKTKKINVKSFKLNKLINDIEKLNSELLFAKIDVEGHENFVLEGSLELFKSKKTLLLVEIEKRHNKKYKETYEMLNNNRFKAYYLERKKLKTITDISEFEDAMKNNINFLFKNY